ncbi:MAG: 5'-3'-deoxyribonucleotidase, partial [Achromobacter piechaudii]
MIILLDQDGVLADFEHAFLDAWRVRHPDIAPVEFEDRKSFHIR